MFDVDWITVVSGAEIKGVRQSYTAECRVPVL